MRRSGLEIMVLSDPKASERRQHISTVLQTAAPESEWSFFDTIEASKLQIGYDERRAFKTYGSALSRSEVSCAAGHIGILERFTRGSSREYLLVLEDDVFIDPYFNVAGLPALMSQTNLSYMKLYARYFVPSRYIASVGRFNWYRASWPPLGTQGYVLSKDGASRMLGRIRERGVLEQPIDVTLDAYWHTGIPVTMLYPFPILELGMRTTIHNTSNRDDVIVTNQRLEKDRDLSSSRLVAMVGAFRRIANDRALRDFDARLSKTIFEKSSALREIL